MRSLVAEGTLQQTVCSQCFYLLAWHRRYRVLAFLTDRATGEALLFYVFAMQSHKQSHTSISSSCLAVEPYNCCTLYVWSEVTPCCSEFNQVAFRRLNAQALLGLPQISYHHDCV